jgi:hypothetical protein
MALDLVLRIGIVSILPSRHKVTETFAFSPVSPKVTSASQHSSEFAFTSLTLMTADMSILKDLGSPRAVTMNEIDEIQDKQRVHDCVDFEFPSKRWWHVRLALYSMYNSEPPGWPLGKYFWTSEDCE